MLLRSLATLTSALHLPLPARRVKSEPGVSERSSNEAALRGLNRNGAVMLRGLARTSYSSPLPFINSRSLFVRLPYTWACAGPSALTRAR